MGAPGYAGWQVVLDPVAIDPTRAQLNINDASVGIMIGGTSSGQGPDWGDSEITAYESQQGSYGNTVSDFVYPNRTVTIPLGVMSEEAFSYLRMKVGLFQREGGSILRRRLGGDAAYLDVVKASLVAPDNWLETAGIEPNVTLTLETLPDWYGDEIALDSISCTGYCDAVLQKSGVPAVILGDYPARCILKIVNGSTGGFYLAQEGAIWGFRSRRYDAASTAALEFLAAPGALTPENGATLNTVTGAYGGKAITLSTASPSIIIASAHSLTHVGTYAVWARGTFTGASSPALRALWGQAFPIGNTPVALGDSADFQIFNLGVVRNDPTPFGAPLWNLDIQLVNTTGTPTIKLDAIWLQPLDETAGVVDSPNTEFIPFGAGGQGYIRTEGAYGQLPGASPYLVPTRGDLPRMPVSGMEERPVQLLLKPSALSSGSGSIFSDSDPGSVFTVEPSYRPCYMFRP